MIFLKFTPQNQADFLKLYKKHKTKALINFTKLIVGVFFFPTLGALFFGDELVEFGWPPETFFEWLKFIGIGLVIFSPLFFFVGKRFSLLLRDKLSEEKKEIKVKIVELTNSEEQYLVKMKDLSNDYVYNSEVDYEVYKKLRLLNEYEVCLTRYTEMLLSIVQVNILNDKKGKINYEQPAYFNKEVNDTKVSHYMYFFLAICFFIVVIFTGVSNAIADENYIVAFVFCSPACLLIYLFMKSLLVPVYIFKNIEVTSSRVKVTLSKGIKSRIYEQEFLLNEVFCKVEKIKIKDGSSFDRYSYVPADKLTFCTKKNEELFMFSVKKPNEQFTNFVRSARQKGLVFRQKL